MTPVPVDADHPLVLALRNLLRRKTRTALTLTGVAVGVASVVALVSVSRGMQNQLDGVFTRGGAHLVLSRRAAADPFVSYLPDDLVDELAASPLIAAVHPFVLGVVQLPGYPFFLTYGVTEGSPFLDNVRVVAGHGLFEPRARTEAAEPARAAGPSERRILVGKRAAEQLGKDVGSRLELAEEDYEVVGLYESPIQFVEAGGLLPFADAQREAGLEHKMSQAMVELVDFDPARTAEHEAEIEAAFPTVEASSPSAFTDAFDEFELVDEMVRVFSLLAVFIGGIGVMNTMLMSVFERTREIGVLRAIGWSKGMVLRQILTEASILSVAGGVLGLALGVAAVEAIGDLGDFVWLGREYGAELFLEALAVGAGMGVVGAAYPTWRALRIAPIEALRYE